MKKYIWYNPISNHYEAGTDSEYQALVDRLVDKESAMIVYELSSLSAVLADKLLKELNIERHKVSQAV